MRTNDLNAIFTPAARLASLIFLGALAVLGQPQQVNLTASPANALLPDGTNVPMWGYSCGTPVNPSSATCANLNPGAKGWSPVVITVPTGQDLTISLTNSLSFANSNGVPTSLVIVGQLGGGLGSTATTTQSPIHTNGGVTWPTVSSASTFSPPIQNPRVQSFSTEVAAGTTTALTWKAMRPGTYLLESGTHPSIQGPMGLYGMIVVTQAPTADNQGNETAAGLAYTGVSYDAEVPLLLSEIDPVQNNAVNAAVNTNGFSETLVWSGQPGYCGNPSSSNYQQCYPPAVNYTPLYYMFNGVPFDRTNANASLFPTTPAKLAPASGPGSVLVRFVNAGLRMHVPSIVGSQTGAGAVAGFSLIAEDGNLLPGVSRVQSEVFLAAGKTYDVIINAPPAGAPALPVYDRELSLSGNGIVRDGGMLCYIGVNGASLPAGGNSEGENAKDDSYPAVVPGHMLSMMDPSKGVMANDFNVHGVAMMTAPAKGTLTLNVNGTFTYMPDGSWSSKTNPTTSDSFVYMGNGNKNLTATVTLTAAKREDGGGMTLGSVTYTSTMATFLKIGRPGALAAATDAGSYPLTVNLASVTPGSGLTLNVSQDGGFSASVPGPGTYSFTYKAQNSQGTLSTSTGTVTLIFPQGSGLNVKVVDGQTNAPITDYRWTIEEDRTFYVDPKAVNGQAQPTVLGVNFHTSSMPFVAQGCTGLRSCESGQTVYDPVSKSHLAAVCDVGNGVCRTNATSLNAVMPGSVNLDPTKRYYISVLPGDAADPFTGAGPVGHGMGGAPIAVGQNSVTVLSQPSPYQPGKLSVFVFEDDFPLNGEQDAGGGVEVLAPNEPGLGGFQLHLWDAMGGNGDFTGQMSYDMFNQPLTNSLAGTIDPSNGQDACPISPGSSSTFNGLSSGVSASGTAMPNTIAITGLTVDPSQVGNKLVITGGNGFTPGTYTIASVTPGTPGTPGTWTLTPANPGATAATANATGMTGLRSQSGITGMIVTCPKYEADGTTLSPLAGQAVINNLMPGRWGVIATPGADRIAKGEEWLQTNTLDGQKAHDVFTRIGEPGYFQEYGPAGYHVTIGFANPAIINGRLAGVCAGTDVNITGQNCKNTVQGRIVGQRLSRPPDERLYGSGSRDAFYWSQCYVSLGDPDGEDFAFAKCDDKGNFTLTGIPDGVWRITTFDQWNDQLVDGLSTPVALGSTAATCPGQGSSATVCNMGDIAAVQWQTNLYTRTFIDDNKDGVSQKSEAGIPLVNVAVRLRDGSLENLLGTDFDGIANFNETFPLFSWYVVETDVTRYKNTGTHVVYDAGGPADGSPACGQTGYPPCGTSSIGNLLANTAEQVPLPTNLRVPGAVYCSTADCTGSSIATGPIAGGSSGPGGSTGRIDPPWVGVEGWQGFPGQNSFIEFGKIPYASGENGGIKGHVVYASTRPFDDPQLLVQTQWEPLVPNVTINLYQEGTAEDESESMQLVDTTKTSSWDDWAQGFRSDGMPNMNCPGQALSDLFFFTLENQPNYLNNYNAMHGGPAANTLPMKSQFKCYDGMHNWNQIQPAPYDGMYKFPSVTAIDPVSGKLTGTNCKICTPNPTDGTPMLPTGKYIVEVVIPPGYELVKEEDKNILIGDNFIAPVTQQFGGLGNVFILPDQAQIGNSYNANNAINPTQSLGVQPTNGMVPGFVPEPVWPCVGQARIVPDFISLFPQSAQAAPFAGATRNLCDRKEVTLSDQMGAIAKFYVYTPTHIASRFYGGITDDFTSEFDPFSPQFGEKFAPPNLPVSLKDWTGAEISRVYADQWGIYNGMTYSSWEVNPPNPTGYSPTMMIVCMNDPGTGVTPDPAFNPGYSNFCYELPFMPGTTQHLDTPVVPTSAFSEGYNHPDCAYPAATPAVSEVDGDSTGPWVSAPGKTLTIKALGDQLVTNYGYSGPSATQAPFNQQTVTRHYGFGTAQGTVTIGGIPATVTSWGDTQIKVTAPAGVPPCLLQQQTLYQGSPAQCGELSITTAGGQQSIDTVTVTIGGKAPTQVSAGTTIQSAIDNALPGDLIMVPPGVYNELVIMWKPVRLQGVGAASSIINANAHPAGKLDPWRAKVSCLFGLATNGQPATGGNIPGPTNPNPFDPTNTYTCGGWPAYTGILQNPQVDRLPLEGLVGWDTTVNGNLAQLLQEPTLLGAYEGSGILVVSKGVKVPANATASYYGVGAEASFPPGTVVLTANDCLTGTGPGATNPFPSNFQCNPSAIDGLSVTNSSQGGGGIFVHAWGHNLQIANNRVYNNIGTLSGGINVGQGESPDIYAAGSVANTDPGSCRNVPTDPAGTELPYCFDMNVNVHHNAVTLNTSIGDELFSGTPAGAGGVTFCTGADYYVFQYNWVCGNMSTGDGGGFAHLGFIWNGDIEHNSILFNQSLNPTIATNGGGIIIEGAAPDGFTAAGVECGNTAADTDCAPALPDGTGPGLLINANMIMGNAAESGSGGGLRLQSVNGTEVVAFPNGNPTNNPTPGSTPWNSVTVTNNIIVNNVAGWDGGGVSLQDALAVNMVNNTIVSNDTTASSGVLFNTLGAPLASAPGVPCATNCGTASAPQPAGVVSMQNSPNLMTALAPVLPSLVCPAGHPKCLSISDPLLANNLIWQNRAFNIGVGALSAQFQQNVVTLFNAFSGTAASSQSATGACPTDVSYWDIGVRGDTTVEGHESMFSLSPTYSVITDTKGYDPSNINANPAVVSQYCNGSRVPPEFGGMGWQVPPGISDATVPNPIFNLTPAATVDEGNNWINMRWGPLAMTNPTTGVTLGNYTLASGSPAIDAIPATASTYALAPATDFFGNPRPDPGHPGSIDIGAVEFQASTAKLTSIAPVSGAQGYGVDVTLTGMGLTGATAVTVSGGSDITVTSVTPVSDTSVTAHFAIAATANLTARNVSVSTPIGISSAVTFTVVAPPVPTLTTIAPLSGSIGTVVPVTLTGTSLLTATAITVSGTGVTVSGLTIVSDTQVTAMFTIAANATVGPSNVTVTTQGGTSNPVTFTVNAAVPPVLTSIAPNVGVRGTSVPVTLTGTGLTGATALTVSGSGVTVMAGSLIVANDTTVTATLVIASGTTAALGNRTVTITTPGGTSNTVTFTVQGPTLTTSAPSSGAPGAAVAVTLTGTNLGGATKVNVPANSGITVSNFVAVNATTVTATLTIAPTARIATDAVSVSTPIGTSTTVNFTVGTPPTLTSISPATGNQGATVNVTLTGTNLTGATAVTVPVGSIITVSKVSAVSATKVTATFAIAAGAPLGPQAVSVTTPKGATNTVNFTVQSVQPTLTSISPSQGYRGNNMLAVTLTGSLLTNASSIKISGTGVTVVANSLTVVNDTTVTAKFAIAANAGTATPRTVSVTTPSGTSNTVNFTVLAPALTSIAPNSGFRGTTASVTLNGAGLTGSTGLTIGGTGVTLGTFTVVSDTVINATLNIAANAVTGSHNIAVVTPGGTTSGVPFTVGSPALTSLSPNSGVRGTSIPVTITASGGGLTGTSAITVTGTGITASTPVVTSDTTVTTTLTLAANATLGSRNVSLTTPSGVTNILTFTVLGPALTAISPTSATHPATGSINVPVTLTGTNLTGATGLTGLTGGVTLATGTFTVVNSTTVTATLKVASNATVGARSIGVATSGGNTNTVTFTVN